VKTVPVPHRVGAVAVVEVAGQTTHGTASQPLSSLLRWVVFCCCHSASCVVAAEGTRTTTTKTTTKTANTLRIRRTTARFVTRIRMPVSPRHNPAAIRRGLIMGVNPLKKMGAT